MLPRAKNDRFCEIESGDEQSKLPVASPQSSFSRFDRSRAARRITSSQSFATMSL